MIYTLTLNPALDMELTVDHLAIGQVHRARQERWDVGGKGFNVSRVLNVLGVENIAVGIVAGTTGSRLAEGLAAAGIRTDLMEIPGETRTNISIVGATPQEYIKVNQSGALVSEEDASKLLDKVSQLCGDCDIWVLSGSLPPGLADDFYAQIIGRIQARGGEVFLDSSGPALMSAIYTAYLAKPNAEEAELLIGSPIETLEDAAAAADRIRSRGTDCVVISLGGAGLVAADAHGTWFAKPPAIIQRNPVGAGDALVAGLAAGRVLGLDLPGAIRLGTACGASAAAQPGTGIGSRQEIEAFQQLVSIRQMK